MTQTERQQDHQSEVFIKRVNDRAFLARENKEASHDLDVAAYLEAEAVEKRLGKEAIKLINLLEKPLTSTSVNDLFRTPSKGESCNPDLSKEKSQAFKKAKVKKPEWKTKDEKWARRYNMAFSQATAAEIKVSEKVKIEDKPKIEDSVPDANASKRPPKGVLEGTRTQARINEEDMEGKKPLTREEFLKGEFLRQSDETGTIDRQRTTEEANIDEYGKREKKAEDHARALEWKYTGGEDKKESPMRAEDTVAILKKAYKEEAQTTEPVAPKVKTPIALPAQRTQANPSTNPVAPAPTVPEVTSPAKNGDKPAIPNLTAKPDSQDVDIASGASTGEPTPENDPFIAKRARSDNGNPERVAPTTIEPVAPASTAPEVTSPALPAPAAATSEGNGARSATDTARKAEETKVGAEETAKTAVDAAKTGIDTSVAEVRRLAGEVTARATEIATHKKDTLDAASRANTSATAAATALANAERVNREQEARNQAQETRNKALETRNRERERKYKGGIIRTYILGGVALAVSAVALWAALKDNDRTTIIYQPTTTPEHTENIVPPPAIDVDIEKLILP